MATIDGLAVFSVKGHGSKVAWLEAIDTGITIEGDESTSRHHTTFYPRHVTGSSFYLSLAFGSHQQWEQFNLWMKDYGRKLAEGGLGPMSVTIGGRNFQRLGQLPQPRGRDAVGAALVLLDLLEPHAHRAGQLLLGQAQQTTAAT